MRAGKLNKRITFESFVGVDDGFGNTPGAWVAAAPVSASLVETTGQERIESGRIEASVTARLRVRSLSVNLAVKEKDRVVDHLGRVWNIKQIIDLGGRGRTLDMLIERGGAT